MSLQSLLIQRITQQGNLTLADYMAECLYHPDYGYYRTKDPLGASGDFTTAPEISQLFGEMLAIWLMLQWQAMGCPKQVILLEPGPGRGTLMQDTLPHCPHQPAGFLCRAGSASGGNQRAAYPEAKRSAGAEWKNHHVAQRAAAVCTLAIAGGGE